MVLRLQDSRNLDQCVRCCGAKIGEAQQEAPFWVCDAERIKMSTRGGVNSRT
jgi:hypothetical protein